MSPEFAILGKTRGISLPIGTQALYLYPDSRLACPVSAHADLVFGIYGEFALIRKNTALNNNPGNFEIISNVLKNKGIELSFTDENYGPAYPSDCGLCAAFGKYRERTFLICNRKCCDRKLLELSESRGYEIIDVKQGYAKCSCAILCDGSVICEDPGIAKVLEKHGIPFLLLKEKYARLEGYDCGFIGGSTGLYRDTLYFNGCIEKHPMYREIADFAEKHGTTPVSLGDYPLTDIGTLFFL